MIGIALPAGRFCRTQCGIHLFQSLFELTFDDKTRLISINDGRSAIEGLQEDAAKRYAWIAAFSTSFFYLDSSPE